MGASGEGAGVAHGCKKFFLIRARFLTRKFDFYVQGSPIRNAVAPYISLAVLADSNEAAVLGVELAYRVVHSVAAVLTEGRDDLVL